MSPEVQERGGHLVIAQTLRIPPDSVDPTAKNFHWADLTRGELEALDHGADFALLLDSDGNVTEGPGFNVFMVIDGVVVTPDAGVLEGITRRSAGEICEQLGIPHEIRKVSADEARNADEIFLSTTAGGVMPASRIDGRIMGNDRRGRSRPGSRTRSGPGAPRAGTPRPSTTRPPRIAEGDDDL